MVCTECAEHIEIYQQPFCLGCDLPLAESSCRTCGDASFPLYALGDYCPPLRDIILQFKFHGITSPADLVAGWLIDTMGKKLSAQELDTIVPVPLHPARENRRGYNQAALFARSLSQRLELPMNERLVERVSRRRPQARLKHAQRQTNVRGAFEVIAEIASDDRLLLVDDVSTSGATLREVAKALRERGFNPVAAATMAHGG